jgi:GxxExxY protein
MHLHSGMVPLTAEELNVITAAIIRAAIAVHRALGPGLLERAYATCLEFELSEAGLQVTPGIAIPLRYKDVEIPCAYRADLVINRCVLVEVKAVESVAAIHLRQVATYLKLGDYRVGLLLNFGTERMKDGIRRVVNAFPEV